MSESSTLMKFIILLISCIYVRATYLFGSDDKKSFLLVSRLKDLENLEKFRVVDEIEDKKILSPKSDLNYEIKHKYEKTNNIKDLCETEKIKFTPIKKTNHFYEDIEFVSYLFDAEKFPGKKVGLMCINKDGKRIGFNITIKKNTTTGDKEIECVDGQEIKMYFESSSLKTYDMRSEFENRFKSLQQMLEQITQKDETSESLNTKDEKKKSKEDKKNENGVKDENTKFWSTRNVLIIVFAIVIVIAMVFAIFFFSKN